MAPRKEESLKLQSSSLYDNNNNNNNNNDEGQENYELNRLNGLNGKQDKPSSEDKPYKLEVVWLNVFLFSVFHFGALLGAKAVMYGEAKWQTLVFAYVLYVLGSVGVMAGAHRLWSHRSFKAKWPARLILAFFLSMAYENSAYVWARDHRVHHKYSETDADPHNAKRGFFFAHIGWLVVRKHPDVIKRGQQIDLSDLEADPIVMWQHKHYLLSIIVCCFTLPALVPYLFWGESLYNAFCICSLLRWIITLHSTWLINSAAHMWGDRPYDKSINPSENRFVSFWAMGEGFHNYHHTFPTDYAASEFGYDLNLTKLFIDLLALVGWVYDRKLMSPEMIEQRKRKTGIWS